MQTTVPGNRPHYIETEIFRNDSLIAVELQGVNTYPTYTVVTDDYLFFFFLSPFKFWVSTGLDLEISEKR